MKDTIERGVKRHGVAEARARIAIAGALGRQIPWFWSSSGLDRTLRGTKGANPGQDEQTVVEACALWLELILSETCEPFASNNSLRESTAEPSELSDAWYAQEIGARAARVRRLLKQIRRPNASPTDHAALAFVAMELGALLREFEANRHPIVARGEKSLKGSSAGGRNKQPVCKRRSCNGALLSLCGHARWQQEVMAQFLAARRVEPSLKKVTFAKRIRKELDLDLSPRTILNVLSSQTSAKQPPASHETRDL